MIDSQECSIGSKVGLKEIFSVYSIEMLKVLTIEIE